MSSIKYMLIPIYFNTDETFSAYDIGIEGTLTKDDFEIKNVAFQADKLHPLQPVDFYGEAATKIGANGEWFTTPIELLELLEAIDEVLSMPDENQIVSPFKLPMGLN